MAAKSKLEAQNPLILRSHRLMEAFAKSDDERDFYLDRFEGFIIYVDLDKPVQDIEQLEKELSKNSDRYCPIPKLTFYEIKKIMEGFVNEKVYDIDTKEKLLDIIQSKDARSNFIEFIYDHHTELEKWQQYYQERSRIRIIEWLRNNHFHFVFEEDLELARNVLEKLKEQLFQPRVAKDLITARKMLISKAKTYYSNEALNPRPKRGRPPKQIAKQEIEPQVTTDIYTTVPPASLPFLFTPDINSSSALTFSTKFESPEQLLARRSNSLDNDTSAESLNQKLAMLRNLSNRWASEGEETDEQVQHSPNGATKNSKKIKETTKKPAIAAEAKTAKRSLAVNSSKRPKPQIKSKPPAGKAKPKRIIPITKQAAKIETSKAGKAKVSVNAKKASVQKKAVKKIQIQPKKKNLNRQSKAKKKPVSKR